MPVTFFALFFLFQPEIMVYKMKFSSYLKPWHEDSVMQLRNIIIGVLGLIPDGTIFWLTEKVFSS